ncbi:MAG TPA: neutral zinc metallopeptidase [Cyclobacteriaceae bacterium]|jgi:predicted metalloprotease
MRWQGRRKSTNVSDQRGRGGAGLPGGLMGGMLTKGGLGVVVVIVLIGLLMGKNPLALLQEISTGTESVGLEQGTSYTPTPEEEQLAEFTAVVLADTEDVWKTLLDGYREPTLVLFSGSVRSACGQASSATGPFYCSADEKVYIDLSFFNELQTRFEAPGDFAQAYVVAHEVGHHIQHLMGITDQVHSARGQVSEEEYNQLSVRLELQADFLAGVWAHHAQRTMNILEEGDIEEALNAASAIGDDRLQMQSRGYVTPDSFTHGTSEQRMRWFKKGFETGDIRQGDTFNATRL